MGDKKNINKKKKKKKKESLKLLLESKKGNVDIADVDINGQNKQTEPREDERDAAGLFYFPWGHERNCHHWSCPVLVKAPAHQREIKKKKEKKATADKKEKHTHEAHPHTDTSTSVFNC